MLRKAKICVRGAILAASLCLAPAGLLAANSPKPAPADSPYYSSEKLQQMADHYLAAYSPAFDKLQDKYKYVYTLSAVELRGLALGIMYASTSPEVCLSWQSKDEYLKRFALTLRGVLDMLEPAADMGPFPLLSSATSACDQSNWTKKK